MMLQASFQSELGLKPLAFLAAITERQILPIRSLEAGGVLILPHLALSAPSPEQCACGMLGVCALGWHSIGRPVRAPSPARSTHTL